MAISIIKLRRPSRVRTFRSASSCALGTGIVAVLAEVLVKVRRAALAMFKKFEEGGRAKTYRANGGRANLEASSTARSSPPTPRPVSPLHTAIEAPFTRIAEPHPSCPSPLRVWPAKPRSVYT